MGVNKVDLANGETLIDLQNDTVTPETLAKGKTAHNAQGEQIIGEMEQTVAKEEIEINVPTITQNGHYELTAPEGKVISKATVEVAVPTQGGGSGIIEVPELPTSNIDENAVYKVVTNQEQQVYVIMGGQVYTAEQYATSMGTTCYVYWVDELPNNMEVTFSSLHLYILSSNVIGYIALGSSTNIVPIGQFLFGSAEYDRGYTDDIYAETLDGVYVTRAINKEDWFIRENGEWKRISPDKQTKTITLARPGAFQIVPDEGKVLTSIAVNTGFNAIGNFINNDYSNFEKLTEECFYIKDGRQVTSLRSGAFAYSRMRTAVIPDFVTNVGGNLFLNCPYLEAVTFKCTPRDVLYPTVFEGCDRLTTINVPWSVNDRINEYAPWGATDSTINYNYTGE